ncbi:MAG: PfkB family carbohydrate kinase, partial [Gammaproteobacteria bacterium]|nr:PfkB family carbohydrate kinase [Gammaproteobacteria bacterium]
AEKATWIALNDYEAQLFEERTGKSPSEIADMVDALIITRGGEGSHIYSKGHRHEIPVCKVNGINDPTGCGDAFRAGILYGILNSLDWDTTGRIASLMGAIKIESHGTQNHAFTIDEFKQRYLENFGHSF